MALDTHAPDRLFHQSQGPNFLIEKEEEKRIEQDDQPKGEERNGDWT